MGDTRPDLPGQYEWELPISGKKLTWRPLKVGQDIAITTANRREEQRPIVPTLLLIGRVMQYGDKTGCSLSDVNEWESDELQMFAEEVALREAQRRAMLR